MGSMTEFRREEWQALKHERLWPRFLLFPVLALLAYAGIMIYGPDGPWWVYALWVPGTSYCWFCLGGSFHEMAHQTLGHRPRLSIWTGRIIGSFMIIPYTVYRETHIRHHAYLNSPRDWELWPYSDPGASLWFRRLYVWFDVLLAVVSGPVIYGRIAFSRNSPLSARTRRRIYREYAASAAFWAGVWALLIWLSLRGTIEPAKCLPLWYLPLLVAPAFGTLRKFTEHLGMASYDPILGTRTVVGENLVTRLCSYFNFELFVHGPHHRYPRTPHGRLVERLDEFRRERPEMAVPLFSSYRAAFLNVLPWLFQNPGVGVNVGGGGDYGHSPGVDNFVSDVKAQILRIDRAAESVADRKAA
jgi:fatty acid desaturase